MARFEASGKAKRGKRKTVKLFSVDRYEPELERATIQRKISNKGAPG